MFANQPVETRSRLAEGPAVALSIPRDSRSAVRILGLALAFSCLGLSLALAGPNEGGKLILHAEPSLITSGNQNLCGWSRLNDAKDALTEVPADQEKLVVFFVLAAFPDYAMPRLLGVTFGIEYSNPQLAPSWGANNACDASFVDPQSNWPADGSGVIIAFRELKTRRLDEVCWFACYAWPGSTFKVVAHPNPDLRGTLGDDTIPSELDEIEDYGMIGFGTRGYNPCAVEQALGACCDSKGQCVQQTRTICGSYGIGSAFAGENTECLPNPCIPGMGACCHRGDCLTLSWEECMRASGTFISPGAPCSPTPCTFGQVEISWGELKHSYLGQ